MRCAGVSVCVPSLCASPMDIDLVRKPVPTCSGSCSHRAFRASSIVTALAAPSPGRRSAGSLFDFLFGSRRPSAPAAVGKRAMPVRSTAIGPGPGAAPPMRSSGYCVRMCDGRYFPIWPAWRHAVRRSCARRFARQARRCVFFGSQLSSSAMAASRRVATREYGERLPLPQAAQPRVAPATAADPTGLAADRRLASTPHCAPATSSPRLQPACRLQRHTSPG